MNKKQVNRKEMQDAVILYMDSNVQKWSSIPKVAEVKNELSSINLQIEEAQAAQSAAQVVVGIGKKALKGIIAEKADILNDIVEAYASMNDMPELESRMADSASSLLRMRNKDFVVKVKEIVGETETYKEVLTAEWGLSEEQVTDIKSDMNRFHQLSGMPRAYQISSKQATSDLETLFSQASDILNNRLDKVMKIFKRRDPNFYNGYIAARIIVDD